MILTAIGGSIANLSKRLAGKEFASKIVEVGGVRKGQSVKDKEYKYGRSRKLFQSLADLGGINFADQNRQKVR